jgi:hypothetical protein
LVGGGFEVERHIVPGFTLNVRLTCPDGSNAGGEGNPTGFFFTEGGQSLAVVTVSPQGSFSFSFSSKSGNGGSSHVTGQLNGTSASGTYEVTVNELIGPCSASGTWTATGTPLYG